MLLMGSTPIDHTTTVPNTLGGGPTDSFGN